MDNQLLIENLSKSFGSTHVLSEINLTIPLGAFTSILGPSDRREAVKQRFLWF